MNKPTKIFIAGSGLAAFCAIQSAYALDPQQAAKISLDKDVYNDITLDAWAALLIKQEAIEAAACKAPTSKGWIDKDEHCAVLQAIDHQLENINWCYPISDGQPYQQQWRKCSFGIAEQVFNMSEDCSADS
jgi:hypothetical protein